MAVGDITTGDIRGFNAASMEQVLYLESLFKAILKLDNDRTIQGLAQIGCFLAAVLHNDIDVFDENYRVKQN